MKTLSRTAAIDRARKESRLQRVGKLHRVVYWDYDGAAQRTATVDHFTARNFRAQILIDTTLDLLGLTADIQYTGGDWTAYIPKEQS